MRPPENSTGLGRAMHSLPEATGERSFENPLVDSVEVSGCRVSGASERVFYFEQYHFP